MQNTKSIDTFEIDIGEDSWNSMSNKEDKHTVRIIVEINPEFFPGKSDQT